MPINLAQIKDLLLPGLMSVTGKYKEWPKIYDKIFITRKSTMHTERSAAMAFLGLAQIKQDGGPISFDNGAKEMYVYNFEHIEIALGYAITRQTIEDNLYKSQFQPSNLGLQKSFLQTKEMFAANIFNLGQTYSPQVGGDGKALFAPDHPVVGGAFANMPVGAQVDLNESSLLNAQITVRSTFVDNRNLLINAGARKLLIPPQLEPVAARLMKTELRPGTSDNDVNVIPMVAGGISDYVVDPYLTSPTAWFVLTDVDGLLYLERRPFETDMQVDFITSNLLVQGSERYTFGCEDPRAAYGSFPTA
jgi:phage major head subunit gpT-like protein